MCQCRAKQRNYFGTAVLSMSDVPVYDDGYEGRDSRRNTGSMRFTESSESSLIVQKVTCSLVRP